MLSLLGQALTLGEDILLKMQQGEWQQASVLQQQQQKLLEQVDKTELPKDEAQLKNINQISLQIKALTDRQLTISHDHKDGLFKEIKTINKSKKMNNAYSQNS